MSSPETRPFPLGRLRRPPGRLGVFAPWPLVGVAVLLVVLIIFTPELFTRGPGILTQAELVVDKLPANNSIHFYVWALGETIRYDTIDIGVASQFNWTGGTAVDFGALNWTEWHNGTDALSVMFNSSANPVALNISAYYLSPSGTAWYVGVVAFYVTAATPTSGESLYSATDTSGVAVTSPLTVSNDTLPAAILLHNAGGGSP